MGGRGVGVGAGNVELRIGVDLLNGYKFLSLQLAFCIKHPAFRILRVSLCLSVFVAKV